MQRAAHEAGEPVSSISFKEALNLTTSIHAAFRGCARKPRKRPGQVSFLVEMMSARPSDHRPFRREPRAVKRRSKPFPLLNTPQHEFVASSRMAHNTGMWLNPVPFGAVLRPHDVFSFSCLCLRAAPCFRPLVPEGDTSEDTRARASTAGRHLPPANGS